LISLETALSLKQAGLIWVPVLHDFFAIPDRAMDEHVFVISDMLVTVDMMQGLQVVAFQGASEWALDALVTTDAVWLPGEEQLRMAVEAALLAGGRPEVHLFSGLSGCRVEINVEGEPHSFEGQNASAAYAAALLYILQNQTRTEPPLQAS
jgi:hypothetical protein